MLDDVRLAGLRANPRLEARVYDASNLSVTRVVAQRAGARGKGQTGFVVMKNPKP